MKYPKPKAVSDYIKRKFGTVARFVDLAKLNGPSVRNTLKRVPGPELAALLGAAKETPNPKNTFASYEITPQDVVDLAAYITTHHKGNASAFARENGLDSQAVAQVLAGTRTRKSKLVQPILAAAHSKEATGGEGPTA